MADHLTTDDSGVLQIAGDIRRAISDPTSPVYANRPDRQQEAENRVQAMLLRAGVVAPIETPQTLALRQHDESFTMREMPAGQVAMINDRAAKIAELGAPKVKEMVAELRQQIGAAEYDQLLADARNSGLDVSLAIQADAPLLKLLANRGRYLSMYDRTKPKL